MRFACPFIMEGYMKKSKELLCKNKKELYYEGELIAYGKYTYLLYEYEGVYQIIDDERNIYNMDENEFKKHFEVII